MLISFVGLSQNSGFYWGNLTTSSNRLQGKITGEIFYASSLANKYFFMQKYWVEGSIKLVDGDIFENVNMRYNAFDDELVAFNNKINVLYIVDKDVVGEFVISAENSSKKFVKYYYTGMNKGNRYFEELYSGTFSLLAFHNIYEEKVRPFVDELGKMRDIEYNKEVDYFIYSEENGFYKIRMNKQSLINTFPENKKEIKKIFRKNKNYVNNERSLIQAFILLEKAGLFY